MSVLDDFLNKAKDVASVAGKKTEEAIEVSKLKMQRSSLKGDCEKLKTKLGSIVYQSNKSQIDYTDQIDECIKEIDTVLSQIDRLDSEINDCLDMKKCPNCQVSCEKNSVYCKSCGQRLDD
ncbi:MAG: hypothetical protein RSC41_04280 [Oscillospiraceae bacterium]